MRASWDLWSPLTLAVDFDQGLPGRERFQHWIGCILKDRGQNQPMLCRGTVVIADLFFRLLLDVDSFNDRDQGRHCLIRTSPDLTTDCDSAPGLDLAGLLVL